MKAELIGADHGKTGGIDIRWHAGHGLVLQIATNFSEQAILGPSLIEGENLWGSEPRSGHLYLQASDTVVRLGQPS